MLGKKGNIVVIFLFVMTIIVGVVFSLSIMSIPSEEKNNSVVLLYQDKLDFQTNGYLTFMFSVKGLVSGEDYFHAAVTITSEQATSNSFWLLIFDDENVHVNANRTRVTQVTGVVGYEHFANMTTGLTFPFTDKPANNTDNPYAFRIIIYYEGNAPASMTLIIALQYQALGSHD